MTAFDNYRDQVGHVLAGRLANGSRNHALWPLNDVTRYPDILDATYRLSLWHLYLLDPRYSEREDVRTFAIWATAAHLMRLTKIGHTLETAERELRWASAYIGSTPEFAATLPFARRLMPDLLQQPAHDDRTNARDYALDMLRRCRLVPHAYTESQPPEVNEVTYKVFRHATPAEFLSHTQLADRWPNHIAAIKNGGDAHHAYWQDLARNALLVFSMDIDGRHAAVFESHDGQLKDLTIVNATGDLTYHHLNSALARLLLRHGDVFKLPATTDNPYIARLKAIRDQRDTELQEAMERARKAWNTPPQPPAPPSTPAVTAPALSIPGTTDHWLLAILAALLLSFLIPVLIILAPDLGRTYLRAWGVVLGMDPPCPSPAHRLLSRNLECVMPDGSPPRSDMRVPIP